MKKITLIDIGVKCPECKHINKFQSKAFSTGTHFELIRCQMDDGGCDRLMVLKSKIEVKGEFEGLKIENSGQ